jgi:tRNA-specific 2-thiouridylase
MRSNPVPRKKVLVAMSGGVDSSVAASLLMDEGHDVMGVTMKLMTRNINPSSSHNSLISGHIEDAQAIAGELGIPHQVLDLEESFLELIVDDFVEQYRNGKTPNPCIRCNRYIKFGILLAKADELGADCIATGHYARIQFDEERGLYTLRRASDRSKDQSYFLYTLTQKQLPRIMMPLGVRRKEEVRRIARDKKLHIYEKPESQEICFVDGDDYRIFLEHRYPELLVPGPIKSRDGRTLGRHGGIVRYTIGQRRGLGISYREPLYVTGIDRRQNTVYVGPRDEVYHRGLLAAGVSWTTPVVPNGPDRVQVKIRSIHEPAWGTLHREDHERARVFFEQPQWAVTPGQAAVFYRDDVVLGGGTIVEADG